MANTPVYNQNIRGGITFTGNTLGIAQPKPVAGNWQPGHISAYISKNATDQVLGFPLGTTSDYTKNESFAYLRVPAGATIEKAYLLWGGMCRVKDGIPLPESMLKAPIRFITPAREIAGGVIGDRFVYMESGTGQLYFTSSKEVTSFVQEVAATTTSGVGAGKYTVGKVPSILSDNISVTSDTNFAGWTLAVIYRDETKPIRKIVFSLENSVITADLSAGSSLVIPLSGIVTPYVGPVNARILITTGEGDILKNGDYAYFAPDNDQGNPIYQLKGNNNVVDNFFASQINDDDDNLDKTGAWGNINHILPGTAVEFARQGWDIANVPAVMNNNQLSSVLKVTTKGDTYAVLGVGIQVDMQTIDMQIKKFVLDEDNINWVKERPIDPGETVKVKFVVTNPSQDLPLTDVVVKDLLQSGLVFAGNLTGGQAGDNPVSGIHIGTIAKGQSVEVTFDVTAQDGTVDQYINTGNAEYQYTPASGVTISDHKTSDQIKLDVRHRNVAVIKTVTPEGNVVPGQTIKYNLRVVNNSNYEIKNVVLTDKLPSGVTWQGGDTYTKNIGNIGAGTSSAIYTITGTVDEGTTGIIQNQAIANFTYCSTNRPDSEASTIVKNTVILPELNVIKKQSPNYVLEGDTVKYTVQVQNVGDVPINNLYLKDLIPAEPVSPGEKGWSIVNNKIEVRLNSDPVQEVDASDLRADTGASIIAGPFSKTDTLQLDFSVKVDDVSELPFTNTAAILYQFGPANLPGSKISNPVTLNKAIIPLTITKIAEPATVPGDQTSDVTYTLTINSIGTAKNLVITEDKPFNTADPSDTLSYDAGSLELIPSTTAGSVTIDQNGQLVVNIPNIVDNTTIYVKFKAPVQPLSNGTVQRIYENVAAYSYDYYKDPTSSAATTINGTTPPRYVVQNNPNVEIGKTMYLVEADKTENDYAQVSRVFNGEKVQIRIVSVSHEAEALTEFMIGDMFEPAAHLVADSIIVYKNGTPLTKDTEYTLLAPGGAYYGDFDVLAQLTDGVALNDIIELRFDIIVDPEADVTIINNKGAVIFKRTGVDETEKVATPTLPLYVTTPIITVDKQGEPVLVQKGETIDYTLTVHNMGNVPLTNIILSDTALEGYVTNGDLTIDAIKVGGIQIGSTLPINIGNISAFNQTVVEISTSVKEIPADGTFTNVSQVQADTIDLAREGVDDQENKRTPEAESNEVVIDTFTINLDITKEANKRQAEDGEVIIYTVTVKNESTLMLEDVKIYDIIPDQTNFIPQSVTVDGKIQSLADIKKGVEIGNLSAAGATPPPLSEATITYAVKVNLDDSIDKVYLLTNDAYADFIYKRTPDAPYEEGQSLHTSADVDVIRPSLIAEKSPDDKYVEVGDTIDYVLTVTNNGDRAISKLTLTDSLPDGLSKSVTVTTTSGDDSVIYDTFNDVNLQAGIEIIAETLNKKSLPPTETMLVKFTCTVESVPPELFKNEALLVYYYDVLETTGETAVRYKDAFTNEVTAYGIVQKLSVVKTVAPTHVIQGDTARYTLTLHNEGTVLITDVQLTDDLNPALSLVWDYTLVDGKQVDELITSLDGVTVPEVVPGKPALVEFLVRYNDVPPEEVDNITDYSYKYTKDPGEPDVEVTDQHSNEAVLTAEEDNAAMNIEKSADEVTAFMGDVITYNLEVTNTGNKALTDTIITDAIPDGMNFIAESVKINGSSKPTEDITKGIDIGTLPVGGSQVNISFQAKVISAPDTGKFENQATAAYCYLFGETQETGEQESNIWIVTYLAVKLDLNKIADQQEAEDGDIVKYTLTVKNESAVQLKNVKVYDILPQQTIFVPQSVTVDGTSKTSEDITKGVTIDVLGITGSTTPSDTAVITYEVKVALDDDLHKIDTLTNSAFAQYDYQKDENSKMHHDEIGPVSTTISVARVSLQTDKAVDTAYVVIGDQIEYVLTLKNTGKKTLSPITVLDTLPTGLQQIVTVVTSNVDSTETYDTINDVDLSAGVEVVGSTLTKKSLLAGETMLVKFSTTVEKIPPKEFINSAAVTYYYDITTQTGTEQREKTEDTNEVKTYGIIQSLDVKKSVNPTHVIQDGTATYNLAVTNTGDTLIKDVVLKDPLDPALALSWTYTLVDDAQVNELITTGVTIDEIDPGVTVNVQFEVTYTDVPPTQVDNITGYSYKYVKDPNKDPVEVDNQKSNKASLTADALNPSMTIKKTSDEEAVFLGEVNTYVLQLCNTGNTPLDEVTITDPLPEGLSFVAGSVRVNGDARPTDDITAGILIGTLPVGSQPIVVSFKAKAVTMPQSEEYANVTTAAYSYMLGEEKKTGDARSNQCVVGYLAVELAIEKKADKVQVEDGEEITYTVTLDNKSNVPLEDVILYDVLPQETEFVPESVTVGGSAVTLADITKGIDIGSIAVEGGLMDSAIITYKVKVALDDSLVKVEELVNGAYAQYVYAKSEDADQHKGETEHVSATVAVIRPSLSADKASDIQYVVVGDTIHYELTLTNNGTVAAQKIIVTDTIPTGLTQLVTVTTTNQAGTTTYDTINNADLSAGVEVVGSTLNKKSLAIGETMLVEFSTTVEQIPPKEFKNTAQVCYFFEVEDVELKVRSQLRQRCTETNEVKICGVTQGLSVVKSVTPTHVIEKDTATYNLAVTNTGDTIIKDVLLKDPLDPALILTWTYTLVDGSKVNELITTGVTIDEIDPGVTVNVQFQVQYKTVPPTQVDNITGYSYKYVKNPDEPPVEVDDQKSNKVTLTAETLNPAMTIQKSSDEETAFINDIITYTLLLTNTGNKELDNVKVTDTIPEGMSFVAGSVLVNGMAKPGDDITAGISVGTLPVGNQPTIVSFQLKAESAPESGRYEDQAAATYTYTTGDGTEEGSAESNLWIVGYLAVALLIEKSADKVEVEDKEEIIYTLNILNQSDVTLKGVTIYDVLPQETDFIPGSVVVNGTSEPLADITKGVNIGDLGSVGSTTPPDSAVVTYRVQVALNDAVNPVQALENQAYAKYTYSKPDSTDTQNGETIPIATTISVARPSLTAAKSVNTQYVVPGDTVEYTLTLTNNGTTTLHSIVITDDIPTGLKQTVNVVTTNQTGTTTYDTFNNVNLSSGLEIVGSTLSKKTLADGEVLLVKITTTVEEVPPTEFINMAAAAYYYDIATQDGGTETRNKETETNTVTTNGVNQSLSVTKSVTPAHVIQGDTAVYTLAVKNTGTAIIKNVLLKDSLNPALKLTWSYTLVNGTKFSDLITSGVTISEVDPGTTVNVQFEVEYVTVPPTQVDNITGYQYEYVKDPDGEPVLVPDQKSNEAVLTAETAVGSLAIVKSSADQTVLLQGTVTYTLVLTNTGNRDLDNIILKDTLPPEMSFVIGSVSVDGTVMPEDNILTGINLGTLPAGTGKITVTFQAKAISVPASGKYVDQGSATFNYTVDGQTESGSAQSNIYTVYPGSISVIITQSQNNAKVGDKVTYTVTVTNTGNTALNNLTLSNVIDPRLGIDPSTVTVDGVSVPGGDLNGVTLPDLIPGANAVIQYTGTLISTGDGSNLVNTATANGTTVDSKSVTGNASINTGITATPVQTTSLLALKTVSSNSVSVGDILTYQIILSNQGTTALSNVVLQDIISSNLSLIAGTLTVNGVQTQGSLQNLNLSDLPVGSSPIVISFEARVVSAPVNNVIVNTAAVTFTSAGGGSQTIQTNTVQTTIVDGCQCFYIPVQIMIPSYAGISRLTGTSAQTVSIMPCTNQYGTVLAVSYTIQVDYQDAWGMPQSYVYNGNVNVQLAGSYYDQTTVLLTRGFVVTGAESITGSLVIRIC